MKLKCSTFWHIPTYSQFKVSRRFRETCRLHPQCRRIIQAGNRHEADRVILVSCLVYFLTLKMEATCSFETSVDVQRTTRRYIQEDITLHDHCYENLELYRYKDYLFQDVTLQDNLVDSYQSFAGTCCLHLKAEESLLYPLTRRRSNRLLKNVGNSLFHYATTRPSILT
jgi:hypothetical protein